MRTGARAVPPLHKMERGSGGEAADKTPTLGSVSPSSRVERGHGGEASDATHAIRPVSPSPSIREGAGGEVGRGHLTVRFGSPSPLVERGHGGEGIDCFRAGTQVKTQNGWHPIETIRAGDLVWSHLGRLRPVVGVQSRPHVGKLLSLRLEDSSTVVWCTPNQQFLSAPGPHPPTPSPYV